MGHGSAGVAARAAEARMKAASQSPVDADINDETESGFDYVADDYYDRDIQYTVHRYIMNCMPQMDRLGLIKRQRAGLGVVVYALDATDHTDPWLSFTYNHYFKPVTDVKLGPEAVLLNVNARQKAQFTLRHLMDSIHAVQTMRHLRQQADFTWAGAVIRHGIVVSVSGLTQDEDQMVAEMVAALVLCEMRKAIDDVDDMNKVMGRDAPHYWNGLFTKGQILHDIETNEHIPSL